MGGEDGDEQMTALWFWELPRSAMGVWAPIYSGFPDYDGKFVWPELQKPITWIRIS